MSGCATVPELPDNERLPLDAVVQNVRCEITHALSATSQHYAWLRNSAVGFQLTLRAEERSEGSADTAFVFPISNGSFTIGFTAGLAERAIAKSELYMAAAYKDFSLASCPPPNTHPTDSKLTGDLGLGEWLQRSAAAIESSTIGTVIKGERDTYIAHQVEFVVTVSGSVSPRFNIVRNGRSRTGLFRAAASREETNTLRLVVKPLQEQIIPVTRGAPEGVAPFAAQRLRRAPAGGRLDPGTSEQLRDILRGLKLDDVGDD
jgi:hypothetical protein